MKTSILVAGQLFVLSYASVLPDQTPLQQLRLGCLESLADECTYTLDFWKAQDVVEVLRSTRYDVEYHLNEERTVHVFGEESPWIVTEGEKLRLKKAGFHFMDITDHPNLGSVNLRQRGFSAPESLSRTEETHALIQYGLEDAISHLQSDIKQLTSFWTRSYRSQWGLLSSNWVRDHVKEILSHSRLSTSVSTFAHNFPQNSVIARLETPSSAEKELIIIGAHQDSLNYALPFYRAPGADDDGSGTVTTFHVLRTLVQQNYTPPDNVAIEFHWYAGEEGGLLGSQDVAALYEKEGRGVKGMLQMDMTAFVRRGTEPIIALFEGSTDNNLTTFCTKLVEEYTDLPWKLVRLARGGSDHMSWTKAGYPAAYTAESLLEDFPLENIHTERDDLDQDGQYSYEHMVEFVKLGIAFVTELSAV